MTEQIQHLIDRIQQDGFEQSEKQGIEIVAQAEKKAAGIIKQAQEQADKLKQDAEQNASISAERGQRVLDQSARDTLLKIRQGIDGVVEGLAREQVGAALDPQILTRMLTALAEAYGKARGTETRLDILLPADQLEAVKNQLLQNFQGALADGLSFRVDEQLDRGFRVAFNDGNAQHDFSVEAIAEILALQVRPQLAEIVRAAATALSDAR